MHVSTFIEKIEDFLHSLNINLVDSHVTIGELGFNRVLFELKPQTLRLIRVTEKSTTVTNHILMNCCHLVNGFGIWSPVLVESLPLFLCLITIKTDLAKMKY